MPDITVDDVRRRVAVDLSEVEAEALAAWCRAIAAAVASFPADDLRDVEPALRSTPGPPR